ncbi:MAG: selenide, water dikinase SelD [Pirellulales bacterium]
MNSTLPKYEVVLLGAGHTNAHVLRMWRMSPLPDARLTVVSNYSVATYSGMLPGTLAGLYPPERMQIDLVRLCAAARARLIRSPVVGLDHQRLELLFHDRPALPFDVLSIGIGSVPNQAGLEAGAAVLPIKPMQTFLARLDERLDCLVRCKPRDALRLVVVGGGAGGVEIAFCLPAHLRQKYPTQPFELALIDGHDDLLPGFPGKTVVTARRILHQRGVRLVLGRTVTGVQNDQLALDDGRLLRADLALWATSATAGELLKRMGLPTDDQGFLLTRPTLQTVADAPIFVVGDSGTCPERPTPKAGVFAVRQGPILWENIGRHLRAEPLLEYEPQSNFLSLLATGDGRALLSYKGFSFHGRWCWRLKDYIDGRFMDKYQDYTPMPMSAARQPLEPAQAMRCTGCGGKVGAAVLASVLKRLDVPASSHVLLGLDKPDDAAILQPPGGRPIVATVDFFASFLDDPYLVGRIAAINSLSDVFALGATPLAALTMATVPVGRPRQQEQLLYELLHGGLEELRRAGATLIGGHTIEGPAVTIGFTLLADAGREKPTLKSGLRPGDRLVLTKPLGSGILLAAQMQARCRAAWMDPLIEVLLQSNQRPAALAHEFEVDAITDVTGFGLAGHLLEMLRAGDVAAELDLSRIPLLDGVAELLAEGIESTLAPANRSVENEIDNRRWNETRMPGPASDGQPRLAPLAAAYQALFDPQTSGGLLLGVAERRLEALLARLAGERIAASPIGRVLAAVGPEPRLTLV